MAPTCETSIAITATTFTLFKANTKETTKEVARPKAAPPLLWWRPKAATFVVYVNVVNIVAVSTVAREIPWDSLARADKQISQKSIHFLLPALPGNAQRGLLNI